MEHNRVIYTKPYDAEVEYLESTGIQYIDTGIIPTSEYKYEVTVSKTADNTAEVVPLGSWNAWQNAMFGSDIKNSTVGIYILWGGGSHQTNIITNDWITLYGERGLSKATLISTGEVLASKNFAGNFTCNQSAYLFALNQNGSIKYKGSCKISRAKIWNGDTLVRNFIPVRVGQIGYMYDKVSGKLFGNKGTGNFILGQDVVNPVPNIRRVFRFGNKRFVIPMPYVLKEGVDYQRYDWLKGDGIAYINTYIVVNVPSLYINTLFTKITNAKNTPLFGARNIVSFHGSHIFYMSDGSLRFDIMSDKNPCITTTEIQNINQLIIDCPNKVLNFNGTIFASRVNDLSIKNSTNTFKIFSMEVLNTKGSTINAPYNGAFGDFILNDFAHSIHLTPCQLLRSIPTYLDANGKARQAGECGMIDLISGKFYGNVVNTGTFTVENNN